MKLNEGLIKQLSKTFEPKSMQSMKYKGNDIAFKTDDEGNPVLLFIGKADANGNIKGSRFVRIFIKDQHGKIIKDHWEMKGKAS